MSAAWTLTIAHVLRHPVRMLLTSLAVVASACMVVWVVSGYDALLTQFNEQAVEYIGRYDFFVVPEDPHDPSLDPRLVTALHQDPAVAEVTPVVQLPARLQNPQAPPGDSGGRGGAMRGRGSAAGGRSQRGAVTLVGTDALTPPHTLLAGAWIDPQRADQRGAVIGQPMAEELGLKLGDPVLAILGTKEYRLQVVGLVEEGPAAMSPVRSMTRRPAERPPTGLAAGPAARAVYVPMAVALHCARGQGRINLVNIELNPEAKTHAARFRRAWEPQVAASRPVASLLGVEDVRGGLEEGLMAARVRREAWAATGLALLAALFIIFGTLSMGVTERTRQFGLLRAIGLTRSQLALVIGGEGLFLALIGWAGGLLAGWGLLALAGRVGGSLLPPGATLGAWCVLLSGLSAVGGSLAAAALPAWNAMRLQPLDAMQPRRSPRPRWAWANVPAVVGLALVAVNPILVFAASTALSGDWLYATYAAVGCSTMAVGFLLLTPITILVAETVVGPALATLIGVDPRLLRAQLSSNLWRTLGTTAALTVGLGLYVALQVWGYSMLQPFQPGDWLPDALVNIQRGGLPDQEVAAVQACDGVRPGQCLPLAVEQPKLAADITDSQTQATVIRQDTVIMIGIDPASAFAGPDPLLKLQFVQGTAEDAVRKLAEGRNCVVPDHFLRAAHLALGDRFTVIPPESPAARVEYTIVGAVALPGWHWMTKFSGLRRRDDRAAAMIFADYETVRQDFGLQQVNFFWMNVDPEVGARFRERALEIEADARAKAASRAPVAVEVEVDAKRAAVIKVADAIRTMADRYPGELQPVNAQGLWAYGATMYGPAVRVSTPEEVDAFITVRAAGLIWASCYLPLITLLVTSLGVVNTVMASVRARRWEFGVLRSQGITRAGLFRMVLAEGLLIGLITCLLSFSFGLLSGWCGTGISQYVSFFGGLTPPLVIPWRQLAIGFGAAISLCLLASLWPATSTARTEPLQLLREGRAAM